MAKLKVVEHKRTQPHSIKRNKLNRSNLKARKGKESTRSLKHSKAIINNSIHYLTRNKLLTYLTLGAIVGTAGSITYMVWRRNTHTSAFNKWLRDRFE